MQALSSSALAILRAGGAAGVNILVEGVEDTIILNEGDLVENSLTIDRNSVSGDQIEIGNAETTELIFDLDNSDGRYSAFVFEGARLTVDLVLGVDTLRVGIFTVDQPPRKLGVLHIIALDNMARFNRPYGGSLAYPATLAQILQDVCTQCGITLATTSFLNSAYSVTERPVDITCHEIVAAVTELAGCCAWMDHLGQLRISWYSDTGAELGLNDMLGSYDMAESDISITGIRYEDQDYQAGTADYSLVIEGNPLLQSGWQSVVDAIYSAIGGFTYRPWSADCKGYPHLWPLDIVNPLTDSEGVSRIGIITNHKYTLGGFSTLRGTGETETVKGYATAAPFTARQKTVIQKTAELETSAQLTPIQQMALKLNSLAAGAMALNSTEYNGIIYWHDASTLAGSTYIAAFTDAGFMWTDDWNDGSPVWNYGFTSDGDALFRYLSVKGLHADWITAGRLSSVGGETYFDLDTGVLSTVGLVGAAGFTNSEVLPAMPSALVFPNYFPGAQVKAYYGMFDEKDIFTVWYQEPPASGWPQTTRLTFHGTVHIADSSLVIGTIVTATDELGNATATESGIFSGLNFKPYLDSTMDIGSTTRKWKDGYFSGTIYGGGASLLSALLLNNSGTNTQMALLGGGGSGTNGAPVGYYPVSAYESHGWNFTVQSIANGEFKIVLADRSTVLARITNSGELKVASNIYEAGTALSSKYAAKSHPHSYLPLSGGSMTGAIVSASSFNFSTTYGGTGLYMGNGDAATEATCNLDIQSWNGIGIKGMAGNPYGDGTRTMWINARTGRIDAKGGYFKNGTEASYSGHSHGASGMATARSDFSGSIGSGGRLNFNSASEYCFSPCTEGGQYISIQTGTAAAGYNSRTCIHNTTSNTYSYFIGWRYLT